VIFVTSAFNEIVEKVIPKLYGLLKDLISLRVIGDQYLS